MNYVVMSYSEPSLETIEEQQTDAVSKPDRDDSWGHASSPGLVALAVIVGGCYPAKTVVQSKSLPGASFVARETQL